MKDEVRPQEKNTTRIVFKKTYVQVTADFYPDGRLRPSSITMGDGRKFYIDQIKRIQHMKSQRVPGEGICYFVLIWGKEVRLFYEENYKWFFEERILIMGGN